MTRIRIADTAMHSPTHSRVVERLFAHWTSVLRFRRKWNRETVSGSQARVQFGVWAARLFGVVPALLIPDTENHALRPVSPSGCLNRAKVGVGFCCEEPRSVLSRRCVGPNQAIPAKSASDTTALLRIGYISVSVVSIFAPAVAMAEPPQRKRRGCSDDIPTKRETTLTAPSTGSTTKLMSSGTTPAQNIRTHASWLIPSVILAMASAAAGSSAVFQQARLPDASRPSVSTKSAAIAPAEPLRAGQLPGSSSRLP